MPKAKAKGGAAEPEGPSKAWLDSYADAMTLLLAFFILLYASSIVDEDLFIDFKVGVAQALGNPLPAIDGGTGVLDTGNGITSLIAAPPTQPDDGADSEISPSDEETPELEEDQNIEDVIDEATRENAGEVKERLEEIIEEVGASPYVDVVDDPRGLILRIDSRVLFRSGEAKVLPDGVVVLTVVSDVLAAIDNLLVVEGHTDDVPTQGSAWPTNWELSTTRATNVLRFLQEVQGLPGPRLSASGYAETRPLASNSTPEGRAENRRVELVILIQPPIEDLVSAGSGELSDVPQAEDFGAEANDPALPQVIPDNLLDLNPEPPQSPDGS